MTERVAEAPLAGIHVLDFTANMSGPMATMILGDQGADVIKVEPPEGDVIRALGSARNGMSAYFANLNRSKRFVTADVKSSEGAELIDKLLDWADVMIHNFRPGVTERLGLDADTVRNGRPELIYVEITGFGTVGPYGNRPAYDHVIQAISGFAANQRLARDATSRPALVRQGIIDKLTGMAAAQATTAALLQRNQTGVGRTVEVRMLDVAVATLWPDAMMSSTLLEPHDAQPSIAQSFQLTETADGLIAFILVKAAAFKRLAEGLNLPGASDLPTAGVRRLGGDVFAEVVRRVRTLSTAEAVALLSRLDIPVAPVVGLDELHEHPQIRSSDVIDEFTHPVVGRVRQANPAVRFADERAATMRHAGEVGRDNDEVVRELGDSRRRGPRLDCDDLMDPAAAAEPCHG
ncbi:MAG: CoA transferase [Actinomycetota bacterium]|nr:CoA transferase [Actinomycetota bacterium]